MTWPGTWLVATGVIHTIFGIAAFHATLVTIWREGLWNTVNGQPVREMAYWFLFFGFVLILFGLALRQMARAGVRVAQGLGWGLLAVTVAGAVVMPLSGVWLLLVPSVGLILQPRVGTNDDRCREPAIPSRTPITPEPAHTGSNDAP